VATTNLQLQTRWAAGVCAGIRASGCRHVVYVPDNPLSHVLRTLDESFPEVTTLVATREEEAFGIAAGLYLGGERGAVMLQSSGLGNSINALTSLLVPYQIPVLFIVSMRGDAGEWNSAQIPMGRGLRQILDAIGVPHITVDDPDAAADAVAAIGRTAFDVRLPAACLLSRRVTAPRPLGGAR
jgi:sulfopyruvate decarboxylase subunit alpha